MAASDPPNCSLQKAQLGTVFALNASLANAMSARLAALSPREPPCGVVRTLRHNIEYARASLREHVLALGELNVIADPGTQRVVAAQRRTKCALFTLEQWVGMCARRVHAARMDHAVEVMQAASVLIVEMWVLIRVLRGWNGRGGEELAEGVRDWN